VVVRDVVEDLLFVEDEDEDDAANIERLLLEALSVFFLRFLFRKPLFPLLIVNDDIAFLDLFNRITFALWVNSLVQESLGGVSETLIDVTRQVNQTEQWLARKTKPKQANRIYLILPHH